MQTEADFTYDSAMVTELGRRERQEDALASDFPSGESFGFVVLADGMGGHQAGDIASKIVVTEVFSGLKMQSGDPELLEARVCDALKGAASNANDCVGLYARSHPEARGMGATLLATIFIEDRLYWLSVGDSPLYLFRNGTLTRLNDNHALSSQVDFLVESGLMSRADAMQHPDQSCLTSVLIGKDINQIDCPEVPFTLLEDDILMSASDGLQFISEEQIEGLLRFQHKNSAEKISAVLADEIKNLDDPDQDNLAICVVKVLKKGAMAEPADVHETVERLKNGKTETLTILARVRRSKTASG
ncbi:Serine/threonine phosphatase stp [Roseovarius sp. THAF9]|uniref:PP2C family protein-serine/threonine phosphatase n=1 Tax=Roseovarius sp. THAF9 TaxID=2587847 RepID=UPI0012693B4C|nr:PP2C family serine/threonine-protein phosphatase [Roseovarius sp. THAF9]QFT92143.1 Serine/threonine phosphatase stp [Roseovarius sp. THAF9]